jgi:hypothetical protein
LISALSGVTLEIGEDSSGSPFFHGFCGSALPLVLLRGRLLPIITMLPIPLSAPDLLEREFLILRAKALELGAGLDRLERAAGDVSRDPRYVNLQRALEELQQSGSDRAERLQLLFSLPFDENWQRKFAIQSGPNAKND